MADDPLSSFHPLVREWFVSRYGRPTPIQAAAWPRIAAGEHVLALAPTGSGKTLTAFLGALSRLFAGALAADRCSILYISPLKALGEDMRKNLEEPLAGISALFDRRGETHPDIRVAVRSGDSTQAERRRILLHPPSILVTTPESLCLMLDSPAAAGILSDARLVIVDEVHALAGNKRGSLLACALGRLALHAGEFQRLALSATVRPAEVAAAFIGGRELGRGPRGEAVYRDRPVAIVAPPGEKRIELSVEWPKAAAEAAPKDVTAMLRGSSEGAASAPRYEAVVPAILERMRASRGLLVFTDSRRRAERLAFLINEAAGASVAWAHHGSLSKEARRVVEERFKAGELGCVVATASLELGIDIGHVDEVILAGSPASLSSALQRIGRAGHGVGEVSRARLIPFHGMDLVLAAATRRGVEDRAIEELRPPACPLDILAQVLLELAVESPRRVDELYEIVLSFYPFERLSRGLFDSVVELLAGRYAGSRLRELEPKAFLDGKSGTLVATAGARTLLYSSGGAIPDRGLYSMRIAGTRSKIGELDEEFVWERRVGEAFTLGAQTWRIAEIGSEAVEVVPTGPDPDIVPFWKGEARFRSPELCGRALSLLDELGGMGREEAVGRLVAGYGFAREAAEACVGFVEAQKVAGEGTRALPGMRRLVLEVNADPSRRGDHARLILHTLRGRAVNEALALAVVCAWEEESGLPIEAVSDDDWILLVAPRVEESDPVEVLGRVLRGLALPGRLEELVRRRLEGSGLFGAQFRENAGRALLLPRGLPGRRVPLWMTRLRAKKLFEAVRSYSDFPVVVETWRSCLGELLDLEAAAKLVRDLADGRVELTILATRSPSPFAREAVWKETGEFMYRGDELQGRPSSSVSSRVVEEALRSSRLRPRLDPVLVEDFVRRLKRLLPGWGAANVLELAEWVKERVAVPEEEFGRIIEMGGAELAAALGQDPSCGGRVVRIRLNGASAELLVHAERAGPLAAEPGAFLAEWLRREGPVSAERIRALFGFAADELDDLLEELERDGLVVIDSLLSGSEETAVIDAQNLELLLRRSRAARRPRIEPRPASDLLRLVAQVQGLSARGHAPSEEGADGPSGLERALERLAGAALPVRLYESEILAARLPGYRSADLDALLASGKWQWYGSGRETIALCRTLDLGIFLRGGGAEKRSRSRVLDAASLPLDFWAIKEGAGLGTRELVAALWSEAWRGLVASDCYAPLREGLGNGFGADLPDGADISAAEDGRVGRELPFGARRRLPRALRDRWRSGAPLGGRWFPLEFEEEDEPDPLDEESYAAERVRALVQRYGLVCRSILERESALLRWSAIFAAMRRLELAGEVFTGLFFEGIDGPQFVDAQSLGFFNALDSGAASSAPPALWINCLDPVASAAYAPRERPELLPPRLATNRLCLFDGRVVAASRRSWRSLDIAPAPDDLACARLFARLGSLRHRPIKPESRIVVDEVNGMPAARSPYAEAMIAAGFERDRSRMVLW